MTSVSRLAHLYEAVFKTPPSSQTRADLLAMEEMFGLSQDDGLARMLVVLLRAADRIEDAGQQRSKEEGAFIGTTKTILAELREVTRDMEKVSAGFGRRRWLPRREGWEGAAPMGVDSYRKHSPLLSYLGCAFRRLNGGLDEDERTRAARWDLTLLIGIIVLLMLAAAMLGRHLQ